MYSESLEGSDQENPEEDRNMDPFYHFFFFNKNVLWKEKVMVRERFGELGQETCCANTRVPVQISSTWFKKQNKINNSPRLS